MPAADDRPSGPALTARVFLPFALGYYVSYFFRTVNAVIAPDLVRDFGVDANGLGLLTGAYFLSFALLQLPLGVLLDRFGPRRVNAALLVVAALGGAVFASAGSPAGLLLGRALIGAGVSAALMASIKAFTLWYPMSRLATLNGWLLAVGGLGALSASAPVEALLARTNWRGVFDALALLALGAGVVVFCAVPERAQCSAPETPRQMLGSFAEIFRDRGFWRIAAVVATAQGAFMATQGLWAAAWLRDVAGFDRAAVAQLLFVMAIATTVGFAVSGALADALARIGCPPARLLKIGVALNAALMLVFALGLAAAAVPAWTAYALLSPLSTLSYSIVARRFGRDRAGRASTAANLAVFAGAFAAQWGIGAAVSLWPAEAGRYPAIAYGVAFGTCFVLQVAALAFFLPWREAPRT